MIKIFYKDNLELIQELYTIFNLNAIFSEQFKKEGIYYHNESKKVLNVEMTEVEHSVAIKKYKGEFWNYSTNNFYDLYFVYKTQRSNCYKRYRYIAAILERKELAEKKSKEITHKNFYNMIFLKLTKELFSDEQIKAIRKRIRNWHAGTLSMNINPDPESFPENVYAYIENKIVPMPTKIVSLGRSMERFDILYTPKDPDDILEGKDEDGINNPFPLVLLLTTPFSEMPQIFVTETFLKI